MNRILTISRTSPEVKSGSGFIMQQFIRFFSEDEMVFLSEDFSHKSFKYKNIFYTNTSLFRLIRGQRFFRWHRWLLIPILIKKISFLLKEHKCSSVLCVYPDEIYLISAFLAAKKNNLRFYPYFHNLYYENKIGLSKIIAKLIQKKIFAQSELVYVVSNGLYRELAPNYPNSKFKVLTHSIQHYDFNGSISPDSNLSDSIVLTFLGNVNDSNLDSLEYLLKILESKSNIVINLITNTPYHFLLKKGILKRNVILKTNINDNDIQEELNNSNLLLLPHGFQGSLSKAEYRSIFPTKILQYLQSSSPILALLPSDSFLCSFLKKNQCAFCITEKKEEEIQSVLDKLHNNRNEVLNKIKNANKTAEFFYEKKVLSVLRVDLQA